MKPAYFIVPDSAMGRNALASLMNETPKGSRDGKCKSRVLPGTNSPEANSGCPSVRLTARVEVHEVRLTNGSAKFNINRRHFK